MGKNATTNAGDMGSILGLGRFQMPQGSGVRVSQLLSPYAVTTEAKRGHVTRGLSTEARSCN